MRARKVALESYTHCDVIEGFAVTDEFTSEEFEVPSDMLEIGSNYFIGMKANIFLLMSCNAIHCGINKRNNR